MRYSVKQRIVYFMVVPWSWCGVTEWLAGCWRWWVQIISVCSSLNQSSPQVYFVSNCIHGYMQVSALSHPPLLLLDSLSLSYLPFPRPLPTLLSPHSPLTATVAKEYCQHLLSLLCSYNICIYAVLWNMCVIGWLGLPYSPYFILKN